MHGYLQVIGDYHFWVLLVIYFAFSAFVNGMPTPEERAKAKGYVSINYQWAFNSLRFFAGDLKTAFANKLPNGKPEPAPVTETKPRQ